MCFPGVFGFHVVRNWSRRHGGIGGRGGARGELKAIQFLSMGKGYSRVELKQKEVC